MTLKQDAQHKPDHVPESLYWPHSLTQFTTEQEDPFIAAARLHDGPDIFWAKESALGKPGWVVTRHALIQEIFENTDLFSSTRDANSGATLGENTVRMIPTEVDPPEHQQYRAILNPLFSPARVRGYAERVQATCDALIDAIPDPANCEFIGDFAEKFPNLIFLDLAGLPQEELPQFLEWERQLLRSGFKGDYETSQRAAGMIFKYLYGFVLAQKDNPERTEFMDLLLTGEVDGRPLDDNEVLGYLFLFYVAGLDTVYSTLGWMFRHLAAAPQLQDHLRSNPEDITKAVEEYARAYAVPAPHRRVTRDTTFHGVQLKQDDVILLPLYLASRDPSVYDNPHVIDINRVSRPVTFARGPHICLGMYLAKREMRIALETFLRRFESISLKPNSQYEYHTGGVLGVDKLELVLKPAVSG